MTTGLAHPIIKECIENLKKENEELKRKCEKLQKDRDGLCDLIDKQSQDCWDMAHERDDLKKENAELKTKLEEMVDLIDSS